MRSFSFAKLMISLFQCSWEAEAILSLRMIISDLSSAFMYSFSSTRKESLSISSLTDELLETSDSNSFLDFSPNVNVCFDSSRSRRIAFSCWWRSESFCICWECEVDKDWSANKCSDFSMYLSKDTGWSQDGDGCKSLFSNWVKVSSNWWFLLLRYAIFSSYSFTKGSRNLKLVSSN